MNLLHVIHDFLPRHVAGSEIYARDLCRELSTRHHVKVLCAEYDLARAHGEVTWRVQDGLPVIELVNNWACGSFDRCYRDPRISRQIEHILDAVQPDVVHIHNLLNLSFDLPAAAHARGAAVVATLHDYALVCPSGGQRLHQADQHLCDTIDPDRCARCFAESPFFTQMSVARVSGGASPHSLVRQARRLAGVVGRRLPGLASRAAGVARRAAAPAITASDITARLAAAREVFDEVDLFVTPSRFMADEFRKLGIPDAKLRTSALGFAPLGARRPAHTPREFQHGRPLRVGFVGTIVWHKGVHVLVEAARELPAASIDIRIFGDINVSPGYTADLRARAAGLPIRFMGAFDRSQTADIYDQIDVLVVPSLWYENSPLVIREAFLAGVPVIGARIGGIPEIITDGRDGVLYDHASPAALAAALRSLIDEPARLDELRRAFPGVKTIEDDAREWETVYKDVYRNDMKDMKA